MIPAGALATKKTIKIIESGISLRAKNLDTFGYRISPPGLLFASPIEIIAKYNNLIVPKGGMPSDLSLTYSVPGSTSENIPTTVDAGSGTLTSKVTKFYGTSTQVGYYLINFSRRSPAHLADGLNVPEILWRSIDSDYLRLNPCVIGLSGWYSQRIDELAKLLFKEYLAPGLIGCVTEPYLADGYSYDTIGSPSIGLENHAGIDFRAPVGTPVFAPYAGIIKKSGVDLVKKRSTLVIESIVNGKTYRILFLHCRSHMDLQPKDLEGKPTKVLAGQQVCESGAVGAPAHLHLEVKVKDQDGGSLYALAASHCESFFNAFSSLDGRFTATRGGCPVENVVERTTNPVVLAPSQWDAATDFGFVANPNGPWSYGYDAPSQSAQLMRATASNCSDLKMNCWKTGTAAVDLPFIAINNTGSTISTRTIVVPNGMLVLHPGVVPPDGIGERPILAWKAPANGTYKIAGRFEIVDTLPTGVRVMLKEDAISLIDAALSGYGATYPISFTRVLTKDQVLSFIIDPAGTYSNDSTGLVLAITKQ